MRIRYLVKRVLRHALGCWKVYVYSSMSILLGSVFAHAQSSAVIRLDTPKQKILMMGADMERSAHFLQSAKNKEEIIQWVFKDTEGVLYLRVAFDKKQEMLRGQKDMDYYDKQVASMQQIKVVSPQIRFWATLKTDYDGYGKNNNLPDWIYTGEGYDGGRYDPSKLDVHHYVNFLADYLQHMYEKRVAIYCLSVGKEWSQVISAQKASQVIRGLQKECKMRRIPVPIFIGPATWGVRGGIKDLKQIQELGDAELYAGFCAHQYDEPSENDWRQFVRLSESMGKFAFDDETNLGSGGRTNGEEPSITSPLRVYEKRARTYRAGLSGEIFFENWSRGINAETRSIYFRRGQNARRMRSYWLFKEFTSNTMFGSYIPTNLSTGTEEMEAMTFREGNSVTIWVMNSGPNEVQSMNFHLEGGSLSSRQKIDHKLWSDSVTDPRGKDAEHAPQSKSRFELDIPAESISRIIFQVEGAD